MKGMAIVIMGVTGSGKSLLKFPDVLPDVKSLQRFLGCLNYIRQFYEQQSRDTHVIQQRLKQGSQWTNAMTQAVRQIKQKIQSLPRLQLPKNGLPFILETNALDHIWAAILLQRHGRKEEVCAYVSEKMRSGIPLTDEDRLPWLEAVRDTMIDYIIEGKIVVVACSALQPKYREILRTADPEYEPASSDGSSCKKTYENSFSTSIEVENCAKASFSRRVVFLWLQAPAELIASRLESRAKEGAHFMSPALLQSQMDLLQIYEAEGVVCIDATLDPVLIVENIQRKLSDCEFLS